MIEEREETEEREESKKIVGGREKVKEMKSSMLLNEKYNGKKVSIHVKCITIK